MASHRSGSRHRSPSPSSKRAKYSYRDRSRSRDHDDYRRHRSSSHRHGSSYHRSSRYDDRYDDRSYSSSSRHHHYDNVSVNDKRTHSREPTSRNNSERSSAPSHSRHESAQNTSKSTSSSTTAEASSSAATTTTTPAAATTSAGGEAKADRDEAIRKRQERIRLWKEREAAKKAEAAAKEEKTSEEKTNETTNNNGLEKTGSIKQKSEGKVAADEKKEEEEEEPQLLQQFAAIRAAAAKKQEEEEEQANNNNNNNDNNKDTDMEDVEQENESANENGKKWSLEDDDESEEESMDVDKEHDDSEQHFIPLQKPKKEEEKETLLAKPKKSFLMSNLSTKPKNTMRIGGFGGGNKMNMIMKKNPAGATMTLKKNSEEKKPATGAAAAAAAILEKKKKEDDRMEEDIDPLEAYMMDVHAETKKINEEDKKRMEKMEKTNDKRRGSIDDDDEDDIPTGTIDDDEEEIGSDPEDILSLAAKKVKRKDIAPVDHSKMEYEFFRKDFYIEPPELRDMTPDQVDLLRIELDGIKIRGVNCPKPVTKWTHCGLPAGCLEVIRKLKYEKPTSIQAQAIPAIMNGRDVIGVAKTGSGKTIAFLLPMFRHIKDQRPLEPGEGPIAIIMTPTRELATQIHRECKPFLKILNLKAVCAYGGSPIKDQIADLKRGCEIIVCTPGRMIDLLCANSGRVTNLRRVTYMVMDEADRMFDMGFEPQVMKIVNNVRPSRQTVLFSATFPRQMEALARKVLKKPLEITVGGRSVVCDDVNQVIEVREESTKFVRLLEILGQLFNDEGEEGASALIFVDRHEAADNLLRDLIRRGYPCQSLHGGKDQADRDSTIADFKSGVTNLLIATSVAARGLDVKNLKVVINYECPNHMEDYVHRVGRTGRAGNKGTAYTFITPDQDRYAMDICKALRASGQEIPPDLQALSDQFQEKVKEGKERASGSGFGGKGLERLDKDRDLVKKLQKKAYGGAGMDESDEEDIDFESKVIATPTIASNANGHADKSKDHATPGQPNHGNAAATNAANANANANAANAKGINGAGDEQLSAAALAAKRTAAQIAARINAMAGTGTAAPQPEENDTNPVYSAEIVINDYPQNARWRVTNREQISQITEVSGAAITTRGSFFPPGKQPTEKERKLYLFIEGDSEMVVDKAKNEIKRILVEATAAQMEAEARGVGGGAGRYHVV